MSDQQMTDRNQRAPDKERFDQCIAMLKGYYDALESRLGASVGLLVVVVGWLISSTTARQALTNTWLFALAFGTLTFIVLLYGLNVARWVGKWRKIRKYIESLNYIEPRYYLRYEVPSWTWIAYFTPVAVLYLFIVVCLILIVRGTLK